MNHLEEMIVWVKSQIKCEMNGWNEGKYDRLHAYRRVLRRLERQVRPLRKMVREKAKNVRSL